MPPLETMGRLEKAVYCAKTGVDRYNNVLRSTPVEIDVRWEWVRVQPKELLGTGIVVDAWAVVDQRMYLGDMLWLGELLNWLGTGSGLEEATNEVCEVVYYQEVPSLKYRFTYREVGLRKYKESPPEIG